MELKDLTIKNIHQGLIKKEISALEICQEYLDRIDREYKKISAFLTVTREQALSQAEEVDKLISKGVNIPVLAGVPFAVKDNILVEGVKCTAASKILENYIAPYDATVILKLKSSGAVVLGKTNLDEFAMGSSTENSAFGPTKNPYDLERVPGGSSGGSAAAVAANLAVFSLGSDTGGSIRLPASFCGVVGLKPTYGSVSRYGLIAFASSLDQIGPMTKNIEDCRIVFEAIKGKDEMDSTSVNSKFKNQDAKSQFKIEDLVVGVPKEYFIEGMDPEVEKSIKDAIKEYEKMGVKIEEISLPHTEYALACYYIIATSEASANLARYDGIRYGFSTAGNSKIQPSGNLLDVYLESRGRGFGEEVKRRIMLGTYALSAGYYDAYYLRAQKVRSLVRQDFDKAFKKVDAIFTPVSPTTAFKFGEKTDNPLTMYLSDIFSVSVNLAGLPALSLPIKSDIESLPVGLQIIGKPFEEEKILKIAESYNP
jgi:aspartyl-tRNA(Asn)/glutamyl-tRNA(Gln) amidotransferase subunit A